MWGLSMTNPFSGRFSGLSGPARDIVPVLASDAIAFDEVAVALYIEIGGTVTFISEAGGQREVNVASYSILPVGVKQVMATGTTASGIHALVV